MVGLRNPCESIRAGSQHLPAASASKITPSQHLSSTLPATGVLEGQRLLAQSSLVPGSGLSPVAGWNARAVCGRWLLPSIYRKNQRKSFAVGGLPSMRPQPPLHSHTHPVLHHAPQEPKIIICSLKSVLQAVHHHPVPTSHPCSDWGRARRRVCVIVLEIALTLLSVPHRAAAYLKHVSNQAWCTPSRTKNY